MSVVIDLSAPHLVPAYDPYSTLVYAAGRSDVRQVLARGGVSSRTEGWVADLSEDLEAVRGLAAGIAATLRGGS